MDFKLPMSPKVKKTPFKGSPQYNLCVLKYLKNKYKEACIILPVVNKKNISHNDVSLRWIQKDEKNGHFSIPENYWDYFDVCKNKRFIVFPFGFNCTNYLGHANYMIYDRNKKSLERFEPYGKTYRKCLNPVNLDNKLKKLFNENLGEGFIDVYYKPLDFLDMKSFQRLQENENEMDDGGKDPPGGYCPAWSSWYAELRLSNPDKSRNYIIKNAYKKLKNSGMSLTEYIRNYSAYIAKTCKNCK